MHKREVLNMSRSKSVIQNSSEIVTAKVTINILVVVFAGISELGVKLFRAKIGVDNTSSLQLFQDRLSFVEV